MSIEGWLEELEEELVRHDQVPNTFVVSGTWPDVQLRPDAPIGALYGVRVAQALKAAMALQGLRQRSLAERSGVAHNTVGRVLRGEVYPDLATLARLEHALQVDLYPAGLYRTAETQPGGQDEPTPH